MPGSLVLGGYDSSRALTKPIVSSIGLLRLGKISLLVSSGGSAYINAPPPSKNFLQANGSTLELLDVHTNPGVPYLYMPKDTCDAIAEHLPLKFDKDFNLYIWDTKDKAYEEVISSPHYIGFEFISSNGESSTINVPFALLNLTLDDPLKSEPTQYFPCSPWTPETAPYHLGRAFLQAALLAENYQTKTLFLSQAPGPDYPPSDIKTIESTDTSMTPGTNPPDWESTWSSTLKALPENGNSSGKGSDKGKGSSLAGGAIAGIVVGAVAAIAITAAMVFWFTRRRRRRWQSPQPEKDPAELSPQSNSVGSISNPPQSVVQEVDGAPARLELEGGSNTPELPADNARK